MRQSNGYFGGRFHTPEEKRDQEEFRQKHLTKKNKIPLDAATISLRTRVAKRKKNYGAEYLRGLRTSFIPKRLRPKCCELCRKKSKKRLAYDHCHETGKFRGWLCSTCNVGMGALGDNVDGLLRALEYLLLGYSNEDKRKFFDTARDNIAPTAGMHSISDQLLFMRRLTNRMR